MSTERDRVTARDLVKRWAADNWLWDANDVAAALTEARADELRDVIAEIAYDFEGHIPDMTTVNLGAILGRLGRRADKLERP